MTTPTAEHAPTPDVFPPTLREVLVRPRWLALLVLCLVIAGVFAWLGQWQLGRAIDTAPVDPGNTEQVLPIDRIVKPGAYLNAPLVGQKASVSGSWVPDDFIVVSSRFNDGVKGFWVTGQLRVAATSSPTSLAVAVGWTADRAQADAAASALSTSAANAPKAVIDVTGRLISDEGPSLPDPRGDPLEQTRMSPVALLDRWHDTAGLEVYRPFMTSADAFGGLTAISSPAPSQRSGVNWLNLFYAVEWAVFAGFAFYLWYRLAKDAWEREIEDIEDASADAS